MAKKRILQKGAEVLSKPSQQVSESELKSPEFKKLIEDMFDTLMVSKYGIALAAPQIGVSKRIFIISKKIVNEGHENLKNFVFINPEITKTSSKQIEMDEGCLSVDGIFGKIKRYDRVTLSFIDEFGNKHTRGAGGLLAEIFQHETDHLDGHLFIEKAYNLREVTEEEQNNEE